MKQKLNFHSVLKYSCLNSVENYAKMTNILTIAPKANLPHRATVIFLHGLGDGGDGWFSSFQQFADRLGSVKFLFPIAPVQPVTLNMGYKMPSWYDIYSLDDRSSKEDSEGMMKTKSLST